MSRKVLTKAKVNNKLSKKENVEFLLQRDIFSLFVDYLVDKSIIQLRVVCRHYRRLIDDKTLWAGKANTNYGVSFALFDKMSREIPYPFHRYYAFKNPKSSVQQKLIGTYASKEQISKMLEQNPQTICAIIYGIYASERLNLFTKEELDIEKEEYWDPALDGAVASGNVSSILKLLKRSPQTPPAVTPVFTALQVDPSILKMLLPFYLSFDVIPHAKAHEIYLLAFVQEKFDHCNLLLPHIVDLFDLKYIELSQLKESHFSYLCGKCQDPDSYWKLLRFLIKFDCRNDNWLDFLYDNLSDEDKSLDNFYSQAREDDEPNYYKFLLRRNIIKISHIPLDKFRNRKNRVLTIRKDMTFLSRNRHPLLPERLLDVADMMNIQDVISFMVPYFLDKDKKRVDKAKLKQFIQKYPRSDQYLSGYV